jgi:hypothetical protein
VSTEREERLAKNEALFRAANERMAQWEEAHEGDSSELYFCECADAACREKVRLDKADYERVRSDSRLFFVVPGHEVADVEVVIEQNDGWTLIEKDPQVEDLVKADPRG